MPDDTDEEMRAPLTGKERDELDDSDFAYIDSDGGRHLPIHDEAHVKAAISRFGQTQFEDDDAKKTAAKKILKAAKKFDIEVSDDSDVAQAARSAFDPQFEWRRKRAEELRTVERRLRAEPIELREDLDGTIHLSGYASTTNDPYDMGWYTERVARGAFKKTLSENPDVVLTLNHGEAGSGLPMARTKANNLRLSEDFRGLRFDADLDPQDPDVQLLARKMRSGNLDGQCSFAFRPTRQTWNDDYTDRTLNEVDIHRGDVSVVTQGANPNTSSAIRSWDDLVGAAMEMRGRSDIGEDERLGLELLLAAVSAEYRKGKKISAATAEVLKQVIGHHDQGTDLLNRLMAPNDDTEPEEPIDDLDDTGDGDTGDDPGETSGTLSKHDSELECRIAILRQKGWAA